MPFKRARYTIIVVHHTQLDEPGIRCNDWILHYNNITAKGLLLQLLNCARTSSPLVFPRIFLPLYDLPRHKKKQHLAWTMNFAQSIFHTAQCVNWINNETSKPWPKTNINVWTFLAAVAVNRNVMEKTCEWLMKHECRLTHISISQTFVCHAITNCWCVYVRLFTHLMMVNVLRALRQICGERNKVCAWERAHSMANNREWQLNILIDTLIFDCNDRDWMVWSFFSTDFPMFINAIKLFTKLYDTFNPSGDTSDSSNWCDNVLNSKCVEFYDRYHNFSVTI